MLKATIAALAIAGILWISELFWRHHHMRDELARKFVHITTGTFISFLPFWVDYSWIKVLAIGFVVVNIFNRYVDVFHAIHTVRRRSWGDVLFGVGVLAIAWFEPSPWLFSVAILQVSVADGLAALAGVTYGKNHGRYYLFSQPKTIIGSVIFLITSGLLLLGLLLMDNYFADPLAIWPIIVMLPLMLVCIENLAVYGSDNLLLPLATLGVLSLF